LKLGFDNKAKTGAMVVLLVVAVYVLAKGFMGGPVTVSVGDTPPPTATSGTPERVKRKPLKRLGQDIPIIPILRSQDPTLRPDMMAVAENTKYAGGERNPFAPVGYIRASVDDTGSRGKGQDPTPPGGTDTPPEKPLPTIPLRFYGFVDKPNAPRQVFFTDVTGQDIFIGQEGDLINKRYKIVKINKNNVEVFDVINHFTQTLAMVSGS